MKAFKIDVSASPYLNIAVQKHAIDLGYKSFREKPLKERDCCSIIHLYPDGDILGSGGTSDITADEFFKLTKTDVEDKPEEERIMIGEYEVEFCRNRDAARSIYIKVGCQEVFYDTVKKIYKRMKSMQ